MTALLLSDEPSGSVAISDAGATVDLDDSASAQVLVGDSGPTLTLKDVP